MDLSAAEDSLMVRAGFGVMLALLCGALSCLYFHDRTAAKETAALLTNITVLENVGRILDATDRLRFDQRAFLVIGHEQLSDEVAENTMALEQEVAALKRSTSGDQFQHAAVAKLERRVRELLSLIARSYEMSRSQGPPTAMASLDATATVQEVQLEATRIRIDAEIRILDVVRERRRSGGILHAVF
jgi:CHASE3 domain sensor protein